MRHITPVSISRPVPAQVQQGPFLSIVEVVLNQLVKQLQDKKAEKEANPT